MARCPRIWPMVLCATLLAIRLPAMEPAFHADDPLTAEPETQDAASVQPWKIDLVLMRRRIRAMVVAELAIIALVRDLFEIGLG